MQIIPYTLQFNRPASTSRGMLTNRKVWYLIQETTHGIALGECAPLDGLSTDPIEEIPNLLKTLSIQSEPEAYGDFPSLRFALETLQADLKTGGIQQLFQGAFSRGEQAIPINGLIWMGPLKYMKDQIQLKLKEGFHLIKCKVGALDFEQELNLLRWVRNTYGFEIEIRLDANGAWHPEEAQIKLEQLSDFHIHSIEQPIKTGQWDAMQNLCKNSPIPIALDEELIAVSRIEAREQLLDHIQPQFLILKPGLLGGFASCDEWINLAEKRSIGWWATSALESNVGLNAIAQWAASKNTKLAQGLGTGQLFTNNIKSPLQIENATLHYRIDERWDFSHISKL